MVLYRFHSVLNAVVPPSNRRAYSICFNKCKYAINFKTPDTQHRTIPDRNYAGVPGIPGSGAGKGGGGGGSVRESGGGLGKYGAAKEAAYFYDKQKKQLEDLKKQRKDEDKTLQKSTD